MNDKNHLAPGFTRAYQLYMSGLNLKEIERLFKYDTPEVLAYYTKGIPPLTLTDLKKPANILRFLKALFVSFILKLSAGRRALYLVGLFLFLWGIFAQELIYNLIGFLSINLLLAFELADRLKTKDELELAREIQLSLLPQIPTRITNFQICTFTETAMEVGGDYYDWIHLPDGRMLFLIGDVSGKGITAALYMLRLQGFVASIAQDCAHPRDILIRLNQLCYSQLKRSYFITLAVAMYHPDSHEMIICRAGHNPILYFESGNLHCRRIEPSGLALGLENAGVFESTLAETKIQVHTGDLFFLYTDGVNETRNRAIEEFGESRLETFISKNYQDNPEIIRSRLLDELLRFRANSPLHDDLTFLIIKATQTGNALVRE
ncbi:serine/threonine-protein phosphatase [candidate division KSB1 bacterium]|nr:serine/threonine-protein phosphatase [candidate division KSB1 bacterium]